jgi:hypothetical protein
MAILYDKIEGRGGAGIPDVYVRLLVAGVVQPIFADGSGTPIITVSGVANAAKTDVNGNYVLFVTEGTYDLEVLDKDATTRVQLIEGVIPQSALTVAQIEAVKDEADAAVIAATGQVTLAAAQASIATTKATAAAASEAAAALERLAAESAASDAEAFAGLVYANQAAGEAATTTGQRFRVAIGTTPQTYNSYERTSGGSTLMAPLATTTALASTTRTFGAALVSLEDGRELQAAIVGDAVRASPTIAALRLGRDLTAGNAEVLGQVTRFEQPIVHVPNIAGDRWRGMVQVGGVLFCVPYDATTVLVINPGTGKAFQLTAKQLGLASTAFDGTNKWARAVVGRDGRIYCMPYTATAILVIDPLTMTATLETYGLPTSALSGIRKWDGGVLASDGMIYCAPYDATTVLIIDPQNQTARVLTSTQLGLGASVLAGTAKYSGAVFANGKVYFIPFLATNVMLVDIAALTATQPTYGLTLSDSSKWSGAVVVGTNIYCAPFQSTDILVIDAVAQTAVRTAMGATLTGNSKFRGIVAVQNKLYGIPYGAASFLVIDPLDTTSSPQGTATRNNFNGYNVRTPTTTGDFTSASKWSGGVAYKGIIYGCPAGQVAPGQDVLICDPVAGTAFHTDFRVFADSSSATKWFGAVNSNRPDRLAYCIPASATDFLIIRDNDPADGYPVAVRSTLGVTLGATAQKFQGGVLAGDSCIYAFPRSTETRVLKINPFDLTATPYGTASLSDYGGARDRETLATGVPLGDGGGDSQNWHSTIIGMDGKIYGIPYNAIKVLIMDPFAVDAQKLELTNFGGLDLSGADKWVGGCLHPNGKIYCAPRSRSNMLIIDTNPASPTYNQAWLTTFGVDLTAGANTPATFLKWSFPQIGADGRVYCMPRTARNCLVIDPSDTSVSEHGRATFEDFGLDMSGLNALTGSGYTISSKTGPDGKIYAVAVDTPPVGTGYFLVIDTITRKATWQNYGLETLIASSNMTAGGLLTAAGRIIYIPRSAQYAIMLTLKNVPPLPDAAYLGPFLNKN